MIGNTLIIAVDLQDEGEITDVCMGNEFKLVFLLCRGSEPVLCSKMLIQRIRTTMIVHIHKLGGPYK